MAHRNMLKYMASIYLDDPNSGHTMKLLSDIEEPLSALERLDCTSGMGIVSCHDPTGT